MKPLERIQNYENQVIAWARVGTVRYDLIKDMMTETYKLNDPEIDMVIEYKPATELKESGDKTYREFPNDKPDREILSDLEIGGEFYVKIFGSYNLALLQAKIIGCSVSYNKKYNVNWILSTHRVGNELKVTRVG